MKNLINTMTMIAASGGMIGFADHKYSPQRKEQSQEEIQAAIQSAESKRDRRRQRNIRSTNKRSGEPQGTVETNDLYKLYKPPFKTDSFCPIYIWDANHEMVADITNKWIRPRGWGRFKQMENGATIHDAMEKLIFEICVGHESDIMECIKLLNEAWELNGQGSKHL